MPVDEEVAFKCPESPRAQAGDTVPKASGSPGSAGARRRGLVPVETRKPLLLSQILF